MRNCFSIRALSQARAGGLVSRLSAGEKRAAALLALGLALALARPAIPAVVTFREIAEWGGRCRAVASQAGLTCLGVNRHLMVFDTTTGGEPELLAQGPLLANNITAIAMSLPYAFVGDTRGGLHVFDLSNPASPQKMATFDTGRQIQDIRLLGHLAYLAAGYDGMLILDLTNPLAPVPCGALGFGQSSVGLCVSGNYAYVANDYGALAVVNVADPNHPTLTTLYDTPGNPHRVAIRGIYAFVADGTSGLTILNVATPAAPVVVANWPHADSINDVVLAGIYAYVAGDQSGLSVLDVSTPSRPVQVGATSAGQYGTRLALSAGRVSFIARDGLNLIDVANPAQPAPLGSYHVAWEAQAVAVGRGRAYVVDYSQGVFIVDLSVPAAPAELGRIRLDFVQGIAAAGDYLYVVDRYRLHVFDVSSPAQPVRVGVCSIANAPAGLVVAAGRAYVWTGADLAIVDVHNPAVPVLLGTLGLSRITDLKVAGGHVYAATDSVGLAIVNVSDPALPALVGQVSQYGPVYGVAVVPPYVYASAVVHDLLVVNVSQPATPDVVGLYDAPQGGFPTNHVAYWSNYAFLVGRTAIQAVQVRQSSAPVQAGSVTPAELFGDAGMLGNTLVAATSGIVIYETNLPPAGDMNCDGAADFHDINPFVVALLSPSAYQTYFPNCSIGNGDVNFDGRFDLDDVNPFVVLLSR